MIIYKITNRINGKVYIGQTTQSIVTRWSKHCSNSKTKCYALYSAIQKYGKENFTVEQIDIASDRDELDKKEIQWIQFYDCISPKGYNLTTGGKHCEVSQEVKRRLSEKNKGKKPSAKCIEAVIKANKGRELSEEQRKKLSESRKGKRNGMFGVRRFGEDNPNYGKRRSDESKRKQSEIITGRYRGSNNPRARKVQCIETGETFNCIMDAADSINKNRSNLSDHLGGKTKQCGGYHWRYVDE